MLGGAYRAKHAMYKDKLSYDDILGKLPEPQLTCQPYDDAESVSLFEPLTFYLFNKL